MIRRRLRFEADRWDVGAAMKRNWRQRFNPLTKRGDFLILIREVREETQKPVVLLL